MTGTRGKPIMIPRGWKVCRIDELGEIQSGRQRSPHYVKGVLRPYLRVANVFDGYIDTSDVLQMAFSETEYEVFRLRNGDILLNEGQSLELVGRSAIYRDEINDCCFQNTLLRFRPFSGLEAEFMQVLLQYLQYSGEFSRIASRTTSVAHLGASRLAALRVLVPPARERQAITETLNLWERSECSLVRLITAKRRLRQGLVQVLLVEKKRSPMHEVPDHLRKKGLGDFLTHSKRRGRSGLPVLSVTIDSGIVRRKSLGRKIDSELTPDHHLLVLKGDFVYNTMRMWQGALGVAKEDGLVSPAYVVCSPRVGVEARYFYHLLKSPRMLRRLRDYSSGLTDDRLRLYFDDFAKVPVAVPSYPEQCGIADALDAVDREIGLLNLQAGVLTRQKKILMQKLLTGQIRVKV